MTVMTVVNFLTVLFEAIIMVMFLDAYIERKEETPFYKYLGTVVLLAILIGMSNTVLNLGLFNFIIMILSTVFIAFLYNRHIKMNVILSVIAVLVLGISEIIVLFLIALVTGFSAKEIVATDKYVILGTILSKLFTFFILKFFSVKHKRSIKKTMKTSFWLLFLIMFFTSGTAIFLIFELQYEKQSVALHNLSILCAVGLLYSTFFALYLYENISSQLELERKQELFQQQIKAQSKHLDEILITQKQIKKLRHDLKNHIISLQAFFEKQDYHAGLSYLQEINKLTNLSKDRIETGNVSLDAILNTKKSIAKSKEIVFETHIQIPEKLFVDAIDICIIFGNALDNCIEACDRITTGDKKIDVSIVYENDSVLCKIVNTAIKGSGKFLKTTKKDISNHGFGIENIESALAKYRNVCRFSQTEDNFTLFFIIYKN